MRAILDGTNKCDGERFLSEFPPGIYQSVNSSDFIVCKLSPEVCFSLTGTMPFRPHNQSNYGDKYILCTRKIVLENS